MTRSPITTHVLDTMRGGPAPGVPVRIERDNPPEGWTEIGRGTTNDDGRIADLLPQGSLAPGRYRITFDTGSYFRERKIEAFYPSVAVEFEIRAANEHYHVPLLLSPFGYSTYRGS